MMFGLTTMLDKMRGKPRARRWAMLPEDRPWFDRPDALETLERGRREGRFDDQRFEMLRHWVEEGYVVVDGAVATETIDGMQRELAAIWTTNQAIKGLSILDLCIEAGKPETVTHERMIELDLETRRRLSRANRWRIHNFHEHCADAMAIYQNPKLSEWTSLIFGRKSEPQYTINFSSGSEQHLHQDTYVFHVFPMNYLIGVWLACEKIETDSGPLVYYPGSHREPPFERFDNYPQTNLKTCDAETTEAYKRYLDAASLKYEKKVFLANKGQALLWHGMLIHGGESVENPQRSRASYVCHYIAEGMNREGEVEGPFNW